ncbi:MAG TPA: hypothetical protein TECP_01042 [Hyphomicrobiaceae bacterium MAG_BT-2024]
MTLKLYVLQSVCKKSGYSSTLFKTRDFLTLYTGDHSKLNIIKH